MPLNEYGIFIRKIRKENNDTLATFANKLNVSVTFVSALENGNKTIPVSYVDRISDIYKLSEEQKIELANAIDKSNEKISIEIANMDENRTSVSLAFARTINTASQKKLEELRKLLVDEK